MKSPFCAAALIVAAQLVSVGANADELRFDRLFVVGDSLADEGAYSQSIFAGSGQQLPPINYRWTTNAPDGSSRTFAGFLAESLGIEHDENLQTGVEANAFSAEIGGVTITFPAEAVDPIDVGGTNYAQGGSRVSNPVGSGFNPAQGATTEPLTAQIDRLLASDPGFNSNDLVIVWGGANDVFAQYGAIDFGVTSPEQGLANMAQAGDELADAVALLQNAGASTILVVTVPDIGATPFGLAEDVENEGAGALLSELTAAFNDQLVAALRGKNAVIVDSQQLLSAIQADPARYGFDAPNAATGVACTGVSISCVQGVNTLPDSEEYIFADGVHPTTAAHRLFGEAALAGLRAATQTGAISVSTLTALRQQSLSLENRLNPTVMLREGENGERVRRAVGDVDTYLSFEVGRYGSDAQQVTPGLTGDTQVLKAGFDIAVASNATVGVGVSLDHGQVAFDDDQGGFDSRLLIGALFGQASLTEAIYVNAAIGGGYIDVYNIDRSFTLGPATEAYSSDSAGTFFFGRAGLGAMLPVAPGVLLNPFTSFTYEVVTIDGFTESAGAASLSYGETEYASNRVSFGLSTWISPASVPWLAINLRGSGEYDLNDGELTVPLGPDPSLLASVSAPRPDQLWGYVSGQAVASVAPGATVSLGASSVVGLNGATGLVGTAVLKVSF